MIEKAQFECFASFAPWCSFGFGGGPLGVSMETAIRLALAESDRKSLLPRAGCQNHSPSQSSEDIFP